MVYSAKNIEFALGVIFVAGLERDRFHSKLDLVIVLLLYELDNAILSRTKSFTCIIQFEHFFRFENTGEAR